MDYAFILLPWFKSSFSPFCDVHFILFFAQNKIWKFFFRNPSIQQITPFNQPTIKSITWSTGRDPKSLAINLATTVFFILPFLAYFDQKNLWSYVALVSILFVVAFIVPPIGWLRPHPYSDFPGTNENSRFILETFFLCLFLFSTFFARIVSRETLHKEFVEVTVGRRRKTSAHKKKEGRPKKDTAPPRVDNLPH